MLEQQLQQLREQLRVATVRLQAVTQLSGSLQQWHEPSLTAVPPQRQHQPQLPPLPAAPQMHQRLQQVVPRPLAGGLIYTVSRGRLTTNRASAFDLML